jgi:hypothetical protein
VRLDPDAALGALIALLIGWTMVFAGTRKRALHFRNRRRRCPSCGHAIPGRVCERHQ